MGESSLRLVAELRRRLRDELVKLLRVLRQLLLGAGVEGELRTEVARRERRADALEAANDLVDRLRDDVLDVQELDGEARRSLGYAAIELIEIEPLEAVAVGDDDREVRVAAPLLLGSLHRDRYRAHVELVRGAVLRRLVGAIPLDEPGHDLSVGRGFELAQRVGEDADERAEELVLAVDRRVVEEDLERLFRLPEELDGLRRQRVHLAFGEVDPDAAKIADQEVEADGVRADEGREKDEVQNLLGVHAPLRTRTGAS
jgi:hypothetical protein